MYCSNIETVLLVDAKVAMSQEPIASHINSENIYVNQSSSWAIAAKPDSNSVETAILIIFM